jgi:hypothetical protein
MQQLMSWYRKYEKYNGLAIFGIGFIWDSLTMTRVDNVIDHVILLFYLIAIGVMIVFTLRRQCGAAPVKWLQKIEPHFLWVMQFCFGGLFPSYVIFYFKSASWTRTQFFFLILVCLWIGNEFLHHRLQNPDLLAILYCFCFFSFLAFFLPVILTKVNQWIFLSAGALSVVLTFIVFYLGMMAHPAALRRRMARASAWICFTSFVVIALYFANLIPPVPLALKDAGIFHRVDKTNAGYEVQYVAPPFYRFWRKWDDPFYWMKGDKVYCYTAIFAPRKFRIPVFHAWSRQSAKGWKRTDRIQIDISGGRDGGFRGFTFKRGIAPGKWRVEVETETGQTLGRIEFTVVPSPEPHLLLVKELFL